MKGVTDKEQTDSKPTLSTLTTGQDLGASAWVRIDQEMLDLFGRATRDADPMHLDPVWATDYGPYGGTIAFGFLTISLLTHLLDSVMRTHAGHDPRKVGHYLNYGFDRLRLVAPVAVGSRVRGRFRVLDSRRDGRDRAVVTLDARVDIEGSERPALVAEWLTIWVPPGRSV